MGEWHECPLLSTVGKVVAMPMPIKAECMDFDVPVCHAGVCSSDKTIPIFVKRIPALHASSRAVWLLQGGPGLPSNAMELYMADIFQATGGKMNVYTMDHRGVGRSARLDALCPQNYTPKTLDDVAPFYEDCFKAITDEYGMDAPKAFSVTSAASDIAMIIQNQTQDNVFVYGVSYGTYLVERLMHLAPKKVKGYILDSIVSESPVKYWSDWDLDVASTEKYYYSLCDQDAFCASKLGGNSKQVAVDILQKLDRNDTECAQTIYTAKGIPSYFLGQLFSGLVQVYNQRNMIPAILYRLQRCLVSIESEITFLDHLLGKKSDGTNDGGVDNDVLPGDPSNPKSSLDRMVYYNIVFNELWKPLTAEEWINQTHELTWQSENIQTIAVKLEIYKAFQAHFTYEHDKYWNTTASVPQDSSVLMLSSSIDPQTIPKYAKYENASMVGTDKLLIQFPFGSHFAYATTNTNPKNPSENCAAAIVHSYLKANGSLELLNMSCTDRVLPLEFQTIHDAAKAMQIFGSTSDMFESNAVGSITMGQAPTELFPIAVSAFVCGAVAACGLLAVVYLWKKNSSKNSKRIITSDDIIVQL